MKKETKLTEGALLKRLDSYLSGLNEYSRRKGMPPSEVFNRHLAQLDSVYQVTFPDIDETHDAFYSFTNSRGTFTFNDYGNIAMSTLKPGEMISITHTESILLEQLMIEPDAAIDLTKILMTDNSSDISLYINTIKSQISKLRKKLGLSIYCYKEGVYSLNQNPSQVRESETQFIFRHVYQDGKEFVFNRINNLVTSPLLPEGVITKVSPSEGKLLRALIEYPNRSIPKLELYKRIYGLDFAFQEEVSGFDLKTFIFSLREKIGDTEEPRKIIFTTAIGYSFGKVETALESLDQKQDILIFNGIIYRRKERQVWSPLRQTEKTLSIKEALVLEILLLNPTRAFTLEEMTYHAWKNLTAIEMFFTNDDIYHLRNKLGDYGEYSESSRRFKKTKHKLIHKINTLKGVAYSLTSPGEK